MVCPKASVWLWVGSAVPQGALRGEDYGDMGFSWISSLICVNSSATSRTPLFEGGAPEHI